MKFKKHLVLLCLLPLLQSCNWSRSGAKGSSQASHLGEIEKPVVLHQARSADPKTLDPQAQFDSISGLFVRSLYDTLLDYHYLKRPYELIPVLLEKMPEISKDRKTLTFQLKKGIHFTDDECFKGGKGRELVSDDVIYTIKRFADINVNALSWFLLSDVVVGLDEMREKTKKNLNLDYAKEEVKGLEKVDDYTFKMHLVDPNPLALYSLAASSLAIVPKEAVEKYGRAFSRHPVGTGAFKLEQYRKKQTMTFVKNENYFMHYPTEGEPGDLEKGLLEDAGKQLPLVNEVKLHYIPESQPEMLKFKNGELSWVALDRDNFEQMAFFDKSGKIQLNQELAEDFQLYTEPALTTSYIIFNMKDEVSQNKNLRKAMAHAINFQKKIELLANGRGVTLGSIVPPSIGGSEREIGYYGTPYDLGKAKEYMEKAGYGENKRLELTLTIGGTSTTHQNMYEFFRNSLDKIGIDLKPDYKTWPSYLKSTHIGDFQVATAAWAADYPDPENFYQLFFSENARGSSFKNEEYDKLYNEMRFMENSPERFAILQKMARILQEEVPVIYDNTPLATGLKQNWLSNFKRNIMVDYPFKYLGVSETSEKVLAEK